MVDSSACESKITSMKKRKGGTLKRSMAYCYRESWATSKWRTLAMPIYVIVTVLSQIPLLFIPSLGVKYLSDEPDLAKYGIGLAILLGAYIILNCASLFLYQICEWSNTFVRIKRLLRQSGLKSMRCDYAYFDDTALKQQRDAAIMSLWSNWNGAELLLKSVPAFLIALLGLVAYVAYSGSLSPWLILLLSGMAIGNFVMAYLGSKWYYACNPDIDKCWSKVVSYRRLSNDVERGKDVRNYSLGGYFYLLFAKQFDLFKKYTKIQRRFLFLPNLSNSIFGFAKDLLGYGILAYQVGQGNISVAEFATMVGVLNGVSTYIDSLSNSFNDLLQASKDTVKLIDFLELSSEFNHGVGLSTADIKKDVEIAFEDVSFTYPGFDKPTLSHLSFTIHPGEKVALVGENGAGKTTIIKLLCLFYKPTSGRITLNGRDIQEYDADEYRRLLSIVNQEVSLIAFPIDQFVSCSRTPDDERVIAALKKAGLWEKVDSLPKKEKTPLTKHLDHDGIELSGGQTQLLMLSRALYRDSPILMLDEPTSALDPLAEGRLYAKYGELCEGKSSIFISHRLSSTRFCDSILYLENGQIAEQGTHEQLMEKGGEYAKMFEIQAHYYRDEMEGGAAL